MTDQVHTNETPRGLLGFLGKIAGPKGFFGPGFWADFKEGWNEKNNEQRQSVVFKAQQDTSTLDFDEDEDEVSTYQYSSLLYPTTLYPEMYYSRLSGAGFEDE